MKKLSPPLFFFRVALEEASKAAYFDEVPIGAVIVKEGKILARTFNQTEKRKTFTAHAEILGIEAATQILKSKYLNGCDLYVTLEPCQMCLSAARLSRIQNIYYLARSPKFGRKGKAYSAIKVRKYRNKALTQEAMKVLGEFFKQKRLK